MKTNKIFTLIIMAVVLFTSCAEDPLAYIFEDGSEWNNERSIKGLVVDGQLGQATIVNTLDESTLTITIDPESISDWSQVSISYIGLSWGASANVTEGSVLDFNNPEKTASITVSSETGLSRDWLVFVEEFVNPVSGTWTIQDYKYSYDDFNGWGNSAYDVDIYLKLPTSEPGLDDLITFGPVEGVEEGMPFGPYNRTAGDNGEFATYIFNETSDFTPMFGQIPAGEGTYYLTQDGDGETVIKLVMISGETYITSIISSSESDKINIKLLPTMRNLGLIDWDNYYASYTSFVSCVDLYYNLVK